MRREDLFEDTLTAFSWFRGRVRNDDLAVKLAEIALRSEWWQSHADWLPGVVEALRTDHPLMGETFSQIASSLDRIAEAIEPRE